MRLAYRREPVLPSPAHSGRRSVLRPRIRVRVRHGNRFVDVLALIDSGADDCLFPIGIASLLELTLQPENTCQYIGIGGNEVRSVFQTLTLEIGDWSFPAYVGFVDTPTAPALLGQNGFFDQLTVKFSLSRRVIEIELDQVQP